MYRKSTLSVRVIDIKQETQFVKRFTLAPEDCCPLPPFGGGSHITTYLPHKEGILERHYSLFNTSRDRGVYQIAVRLNEDSSGGSRYWHECVLVGDVLSVSYPKNHFQLSFRAKHHVFYAAGVGITPFLSMMAELSQKDISFELHYAARSKEWCAFYEFLRETYLNECHYYFSQGSELRRLSPRHLVNHRIGTHVYFCGPEDMIHDFTEAARSYGYPSLNVHYERFALPQKKERNLFQVELKRSGLQLDVPPEHSLLEVLLEAGIRAPHSCRVGGCGTCEISVLEGQIDHYDVFLTEEQRCSQQMMLTCISRGQGKLVLDI